MQFICFISVLVAQSLANLYFSGETFLETQTRLLRERELKIRNALENLRRKRSILRTQRQKREFPVISVMGYTNCGKKKFLELLHKSNLHL